MLGSEDRSAGLGLEDRLGCGSEPARIQGRELYLVAAAMMTGSAALRLFLNIHLDGKKCQDEAQRILRLKTS